MFRSKNIYNDMCKKSSGILHKVTPEERRKIQLHLCKMYKDLEQVCDRHGLTIMMAFGSALGAVRHKGFIPWDDDMDVFMPRADYTRLITQHADELSDNYIIYAPNSKNGAIARFAKLVDKNTLFVEVGSEKIDRHPGVFIDIFPLDSITTNQLSNKVKKMVSMALIFTAASVRQYELNSDVYKSIMSGCRAAKFNYWFRQIHGFLFSFINEQQWYKLVDKFCENPNDSNYIDFVQSDYRWKPLDINMFYPPVKGQFEGMEVYIPHHPIDYLKMEFGNWQWIPPEEERFEHYVIDLKI